MYPNHYMRCAGPATPYRSWALSAVHAAAPAVNPKLAVIIGLMPAAHARPNNSISAPSDPQPPTVTKARVRKHSKEGLLTCAPPKQPRREPGTHAPIDIMLPPHAVQRRVEPVVDQGQHSRAVAGEGAAAGDLVQDVVPPQAPRDATAHRLGRRTLGPSGRSGGSSCGRRGGSTLGEGRCLRTDG